MYRRHRFPIIILLTLTLAAAWGGAAWAAQGPQQRLQEGIDQVLAVLKKYEGQKDKRTEIADELRTVIPEYFDFEELTMRAVGRPWLDFTEEQRKAFTDAFTELLEKTYLQKLDDYNDEQVQYVDEKMKEDRAFVLTKVEHDGKEIPINYRMIMKDQWMVYDVIIEGVSLVKNYRSQFAKLLRTESPDEVIARIREKIKALDKGSDDGKDQLS